MGAVRDEKASETPTKAAVLRWLSARVGMEIETVQRRPCGSEWQPGPRTLARKGNMFRLADSRINLTRNHVPVSVASDHVTIEWRDDEGTTIHVTTYRELATGQR